MILESNFHWKSFVMMFKYSHYYSDLHMRIVPNNHQLFIGLSLLFKNLINSTSVRSNYTYPSISGSSAFHSQLHVQESWLLQGHFLKIKHALVLGSEVTWLSDNVPIVTGCYMRIKEVINQLTGLRGQYCSLQGKQCSHSALVADWGTTALLQHAAADSVKPK